jgi:hypothetical protein
MDLELNSGMSEEEDDVDEEVWLVNENNKWFLYKICKFSNVCNNLKTI